jgi:hypothetical protein
MGYDLVLVLESTAVVGLPSTWACFLCRSMHSATDESPSSQIARSEVSAARSADFLISILADWVTKDSSSGSEIGSDQA